MDIGARAANVAASSPTARPPAATPSAATGRIVRALKSAESARPTRYVRSVEFQSVPVRRDSTHPVASVTHNGSAP